MFTGIVEEVGRVVALERREDHARVAVACRQVLADAVEGASIAVDGACLTVVAFLDGEPGFVADLMPETLRATTLGQLSPGDRVNLERPMSAGGRFSGHLVQGHVDGVGEIVDRQQAAGTVSLQVAAPAQVARYLVPKGSVTVQGVSLTVVDVAEDGAFDVGLIPHTCATTTLGSLRVGDRLNLEGDVIAKYVQRLLQGDRLATPYRQE
ncbi:MAG TPA: riboflavin synthase [Nitriliruptorales bacterium]|nr:riboflavin synthase [Nitriliruptorales bacterium]